MKVLLIGATGLTGQEILPLLLKAGHEVTAFVRNPEGLKNKSEHVKIVIGDARNQADVEKATEGNDAVIVALGPRSLEKSDLQEVFMRNLVGGMKKHGVKRIVNLSAWGGGTTAPYISPVFWVFRNTILKNVFDDKERGLKILADSGLDYVNACPGRLGNKPARGGVRASENGKGISAFMTRADLAQWMVDQLTSDTWVRKDAIVGY